MRWSGVSGWWRSHLVEVGSVVMSVGLVGALVVGTVGRRGRASSKVSLSTGSAWFPSPDVGRVALIDGTTVTRVVEVAVSAPGAGIEVAQAGSSGYVVDHSTGGVRRVDGASLKVGDVVSLSSPGDARLAIRSTGKVTWAVARGGSVVQQLDPVSLVPLGTLGFPGNAAAPVLGLDGTLWLVDGGLLRSFRASKVRTSVQLSGVGLSRLVMAAGHPVVLDAEHHRAIEINTDSGHQMRVGCYDVPPSELALVSGSNSGSPLVLAVNPGAGTLMVSDLKGGGCLTVELGAGSSDRYGEPVESAGLVYVPDYVTGAVIVVDARSGKVLGRPAVDNPVSRFSLLAHHGFVWFDDARSDMAGVVTLEGAKEVSTKGGDKEGKAFKGKPSPANPNPSPKPNPIQNANSNPGPSQGPSPNPNPQSNSNPSPSPKPPPTPTFVFTPNPGVVGKPVTFSDTTSGTHTVTGWTFASGQPATSTSPNPTVTWSSPGTYAVTVTVSRDGSGASASQQVQIVAPGNVVVPDVSRMTVAAATAQLKRAQLTVGTSSTVDSFAPKGEVARTTPAAGTSVPPGTPIDLGISDETGPVATYAGDGVAGLGGSPGPAMMAQVTAPARLSFDGAGNLYIAAYANNEVQRVSPSGYLTVVAGTGTKGHQGDLGPATAAELNGPIATAVDLSGNLYIAEAPDFSGTGAIRKVDALGIITTLTNFASPWDLKIDARGMLYVAGRFGNCSIATVDTSTGSSTPVVGTPGTCTDSATTLSDPASVTFDATGAMYISEPHAEIIRRFQNGKLTTVAGTGTAGYTGDGGPAVSAQLHDPDDIAFDSFGDLFLTDWSNLVVREISSDGTIQTIAGTGTSGFSGDGGPANKAQFYLGQNSNYSTGVAIDGSDHIFVSDTNNNRIREIT